MSLYKVPLFQQPRGHVQVEQGATKGATIGLNVWNADGTLFVPAAASGSTSTPVVGSTLWELVLKIPANITGLAAVTTDGWFRKDAAAIAARELLGSDLPDLADSGVGAALVKITRDAKGRVEGTQAANLADLADVAATAPSDGQVLTYDTTNGWQPETPSGGGSSAWTTIKKTADENRASTTTLADDSQLTVALNAGTYHIRAKLIFEVANATMDLKCAPAFSGTAASIFRKLEYTQSSGGTAVVFAPSFGQLTPDFAAAGSGFAEYDIVFTASTGGTFSFQWAQNTSNASNLTLHRGSYLEYMAV